MDILDMVDNLASAYHRGEVNKEFQYSDLPPFNEWLDSLSLSDFIFELSVHGGR